MVVLINFFVGYHHPPDSLGDGLQSPNSSNCDSINRQAVDSQSCCCGRLVEIIPVSWLGTSLVEARGGILRTSSSILMLSLSLALSLPPPSALTDPPAPRTAPNAPCIIIHTIVKANNNFILSSFVHKNFLNTACVLGTELHCDKRPATMLCNHRSFRPDTLQCFPCAIPMLVFTIYCYFLPSQ